jgi:hypothetical protein
MTTPLADYLSTATVYEVLGLIVAEFRSDPTSVACFDRRLVDRATQLVAAHEAHATDADTPPPLEINGVAYTPATWRDAYELVVAAMRAAAAEDPHA